MPGSRIVDAGLDGMGASIQWLRETLAASDVRLHPSSGLARLLKSGENFAALARTRPTLTYAGPDGLTRAQTEFLDVTGVDYLTKALHRGATHGMRPTRGQLALLTKTNPVLTAPARHSHKDRNVTWELLLAALVAPFAREPRLVDPPDVVCRFGRSVVGLSAKMIYSRRPDEFRKDVVKAAHQLDQSDVDFGFLAFNLVEVFPHKEFMANFRRASADRPEAFELIMNKWAETFVDCQELDRIGPNLRATKALALMLFVPTALHFAGQPCTYYRLHYVVIGDSESRALPFLQALNQSSQAVLRWQTAKAG